MNHSKGARLYLKPRDSRSDPRWIIRDGQKRISTGFIEADKAKAEAALMEYITALRPAPIARSSCVYFIGCGDFVKIGTAVDPMVRLRSLRVGNPFPLAVLRVVPGDIQTEWAFHRRFRRHLHRDEWFRIEGELKSWLTDTSFETGNLRASIGEQNAIFDHELDQTSTGIIEVVG